MHAAAGKAAGCATDLYSGAPRHFAQANNLQDNGKMEAWLVLHSDGGRVAFGLADGVDQRTFSEAVSAGRVEEVIRFFPVQRGDLVFSPPGTVHALCSGVVIYEVQQSSDLTFRIYDYDRPGLDGKPRKLHLQQALDVIDFSETLPPPQAWSTLPGASEEGWYRRLRAFSCAMCDLYNFLRDGR